MRVKESSSSSSSSSTATISVVPRTQDLPSLLLFLILLFPPLPHEHFLLLLEHGRLRHKVLNLASLLQRASATFTDLCLLSSPSFSHQAHTSQRLAPFLFLLPIQTAVYGKERHQRVREEREQGFLATSQVVITINIGFLFFRSTTASLSSPQPSFYSENGKKKVDLTFLP